MTATVPMVVDIGSSAFVCDGKVTRFVKHSDDAIKIFSFIFFGQSLD